MKFLKTKWYLYTVTGHQKGVVRGLPLNTKRDAKRVLAANKHAYQKWTTDKGDFLSSVLNRFEWEVI